SPWARGALVGAGAVGLALLVFGLRSRRRINFIHVGRLVVLVGLLSTQAWAETPVSFDDCLVNLRHGPDSFIEYTCLGTPGLPERPSEVRKTLLEVLRRKPGEPHARMYLALMQAYALRNVPEAEFLEPLRTFEHRGQWIDAFFAELGVVERACLM